MTVPVILLDVVVGPHDVKVHFRVVPGFEESVVQGTFEIGTFVIPVPVVDESVDSVRCGSVDPPFDDLRVVVHFVAP